MTTHRLETAEVDIAYDVRGELPAADGRPPLFMIGQPMDASGFATLASLVPDRTVITYDPRGLGRSTRKDGRGDHAPTVQAEDVHAVIEALGVGPVEMFASSGGAVTAFALVAAYPDDVTILVAHEPPLIPVLPDAEAAERARAGVRDAYEAGGSGAGMAAFIAMTSWRGEFTDDYFAQPTPDPAQFRSGGDLVPEPPRRLPRWRVRIRRPARGLRAQAASCPPWRRPTEFEWSGAASISDDFGVTIPARQTRARYSADTITVYQAYLPEIAEPALAAGRFVAPFKRGRMTWISPRGDRRDDRRPYHLTDGARPP